MSNGFTYRGLHEFREFDVSIEPVSIEPEMKGF